MDPINEKDIIAAVLSGNAEAYADLVRTHQVRVRLICLAFLHDPSEADDAAQEAFLKAYQALASFKGESSFGTWISHIASNHCRDVLRKTQRRQTDSLDALVEKHGDQLKTLLRDPDAERTHSHEDLELLGKVFGSLLEDEREILVMRELEEQSYDEIASKLQCSLDAVKGRLKRARQRLIDKCRIFFDTSIEIKRPY